MKKFLVFLSLFLFGFLNSCSFLTMTFDVTSSTSTTTSFAYTNSLGTMTLSDEDYDNFSVYHSSTYDLTDINAYNEILIATRDHIRRSNVQITSTQYNYVTTFPGNTFLKATGVSLGSGVIFLEDNDYYYCLTNHHVIGGDADKFVYEVQTFNDYLISEATLIASDESLDLAVLRFPKEDRSDIYIIDYMTRVYTKFNTDELVMACGNPLDVINNVTIGQFKDMEYINNAEFKVIYHDAPIHEGSSGGALVDVDGHLLGLNTWGLEDDDEYSFSVPISIIYMFLYNNGII